MEISIKDEDNKADIKHIIIVNKDVDKVKAKSVKRGSYFCEYCKKEFSRRDRLDRHLFTHTRLKPFKCNKENCEKEYTNESHLRRHIRTSHENKPKIGEYVCKHPQCGQEFTNLSNMKRHFHQQHVVGPTFYSCTECDKSFRRKNQLQKHLKIAHSIGDFKYTCCYCEKGYFTRNAYSKHLKTHDKKVFPCDNCEQSFIKWSDYVRHRREAHKVVQVGYFICDLCPKTFTWKRSLRFHMKSHELINKVFKCSYKNCSKSYRTKSNLQFHIKSKHENKKYKCPICNLELSSKQRFKQHINRHNDPDVPLRESCLSLLIGIQMETVDGEDLKEIEMPKKIDVPTESEFSD